MKIVALLLFASITIIDPVRIKRLTALSLKRGKHIRRATTNLPFGNIVISQTLCR